MSRHLVIVPGIHQSGAEARQWAGEMARYIDTHAPGWQVHVYSAGWISAVSIAFPVVGRLVRHSHVRRFQKWVAKKFGTVRPAVVAHSFGAYIVRNSWAMKTKHPRTIFGPVIFMGGAVSTRCPLEEEQRHFSSLLNLCSAEDNVLRISVIGQAGLLGFQQVPPAVNIFLEYEHGDYLRNGLAWQLIVDALKDSEHDT